MFHVEHKLIYLIGMFHVEHRLSFRFIVQIYLLPTDVPRGTLNNDNNATNAHTPSNITKG